MKELNVKALKQYIQDMEKSQKIRDARIKNYYNTWKSRDFKQLENIYNSMVKEFEMYENQLQRMKDALVLLNLEESL